MQACGAICRSTAFGVEHATTGRGVGKKAVVMACKFGKREVCIYFNLLINPTPQPGRMGIDPSRVAISILVGVVQVRRLGFSRI